MNKRKILFGLVLLNLVLNPFWSKISAEFESEIITRQITAFPDTDSNSIEGKAAFELKSRKIIGGRPDGNFDGEASVNRAELAKFLLLAKKIDVGNLQNNNRFPDLLDGEWYVKYVIKAAQLGIINGYPSGIFDPSKTVNTAEFLKMVTKAFNLPENVRYDYTDISDSDWFGRYVGIAQTYDLFPHRDPQFLDPAKELSRNEVAVAIWKILQNQTEDQYSNTDISTSSIEQEKLELEKQRLEIEKERLALEKSEVSKSNGDGTHMVEVNFRGCEIDHNYIPQIPNAQATNFMLCEFQLVFNNPREVYSVDFKDAEWGYGLYKAHSGACNGREVANGTFSKYKSQDNIFAGKNGEIINTKIWFEIGNTSCIEDYLYIPIKKAGRIVDTVRVIATQSESRKKTLGCVEKHFQSKADQTLFLSILDREKITNDIPNGSGYYEQYMNVLKCISSSSFK